MQALLNWLDHSEFIELAGASGTLIHFSALADDPELKKQIEALETCLYAAKVKTQWSGNKLSAAVQRVRKNLVRHQAHPEPHRLPALNP